MRTVFTLFAMNKLKLEKSERSLRREAKKSNVQLQQSLSLNDVVVTEASADVTVHILSGENSDSDLSDCFPDYIHPFVEGLFDANIELRLGERWLCDSSDSDSETDLSTTISDELAAWAVYLFQPLEHY